MAKGEKDRDPQSILGGTLNILGLHIDLAQLLESPEEVRKRLEDLGERLKEMGGSEARAGQGRHGNVAVSGYIRTRGVLGDQEYHIGTAGRSTAGAGEKPRDAESEVLEPPVDVFDEGEEITVIADVPGVGLGDLELKVDGKKFSLSTKAPGPRRYHKELALASEVDPASLKATCRNGVLEVKLRKKGAGQAGGAR